MLESLFLICALSLPSNHDSQYSLLVQFIGKYAPGYEVVLVNKEEKLLNKAEELPFLFREMRIHLLKSA